MHQIERNRAPAQSAHPALTFPDASDFRPRERPARVTPGVGAHRGPDAVAAPTPLGSLGLSGHHDDRNGEASCDRPGGVSGVTSSEGGGRHGAVAVTQVAVRPVFRDWRRSRSFVRPLAPGDRNGDGPQPRAGRDASHDAVGRLTPALLLRHERGRQARADRGFLSGRNESTSDRLIADIQTLVIVRRTTARRRGRDGTRRWSAATSGLSQESSQIRLVPIPDAV